MSKNAAQSQQVFYRVMVHDLGEVAVIEPTGYYERVTEDGRHLECVWIGDFPSFKDSKVKEVCFASSIAGCFLSIARWLEPGTFYVYATTEAPEVDLRDYQGYGDFGVVGEVRYRRPVVAVRVREIEATPRFVKQFKEIQRQCCNWGHYDAFEARRRLKKQQMRYSSLSEKGILALVQERLRTCSEPVLAGAGRSFCHKEVVMQ